MLTSIAILRCPVGALSGIRRMTGDARLFLLILVILTIVSLITLLSAPAFP